MDGGIRKKITSNEAQSCQKNFWEVCYNSANTERDK